MAQNLPTQRRDMREMSPFSMLQERIDRMFDDFSTGFGFAGMPRMLGGDFELTPSLEMHEQNGKLLVNAELPGVDEKDIDLSVDGDVLTISGEKKSEIEDKQNGYRSERMYGRFSRSVQLPFSVDAAKVEARYDRGVLKLTIPRPAEAQQKSKKIEIRH